MNPKPTENKKQVHNVNRTNNFKSNSRVIPLSHKESMNNSLDMKKKKNRSNSKVESKTNNSSSRPKSSKNSPVKDILPTKESINISYIMHNREEKSIDKILDIRKHLGNYYIAKSEKAKDNIFKEYMTTHDDRNVVERKKEEDLSKYANYKEKVLSDIKNKKTQTPTNQKVTENKSMAIPGKIVNKVKKQDQAPQKIIIEEKYDYPKDDKVQNNINLNQNKSSKSSDINTLDVDIKYTKPNETNKSKTLNKDQIQYNFKTDIIKKNPKVTMNKIKEDPIIERKLNNRLENEENNSEYDTFLSEINEKYALKDNFDMPIKAENRLNFNNSQSINTTLPSNSLNRNEAWNTNTLNDSHKNIVYSKPNKREEDLKMINCYVKSLTIDDPKTIRNTTINNSERCNNLNIDDKFSIDNNYCRDSEVEQEKLRFEINRKIKNQAYENEYNRATHNIDYVNERLKLNEISKNYLINKIGEFTTVKTNDSSQNIGKI